MPATKAPALAVEDLPAVATLREIADFERCDFRTVRRAFDDGQLPGAFRRGRSIRVVTAVYLEALGLARDAAGDVGE